MEEYLACKFQATRKCSRFLFELFGCRACQVPAKVVEAAFREVKT